MPSGAAAAAGCAPWCRRTGAVPAESPGPAGSSALWLWPERSAYGSAAPAPGPLLLEAGWRSQQGSRGVDEAVWPTGPAQPTGSGALSQTGSRLRPAPNETEDHLWKPDQRRSPTVKSCCLNQKQLAHTRAKVQMFVLPARLWHRALPKLQGQP